MDFNQKFNSMHQDLAWFLPVSYLKFRLLAVYAAVLADTVGELPPHSANRSCWDLLNSRI
jgi:hypothetical protein